MAMQSPKKPLEVLVFFSFKNHKTGYYNVLYNPLVESSPHYNLKLSRGSLKDLHIEIVDNKLKITESMTGRALDTFDFVVLELWLKSPQQALAASIYMERHNIPFRGKEAARVVASTKIGEMARMSDTGLPLPRTFMSSHREILKRFKSESIPIQYPFIVKAADTFGGKLNYLVYKYEELKNALTNNPNQFFLLQEYIPNDCDYRFLVMGGNIRLVMKRTRDNSSESHLNNTSAGASGEFVPLESISEAMQKDVLLAAEKTLRSDFAGVDVMIDKNTGQHYILEVNEAPAIQTGESPEVKIPVLMEYIKESAVRRVWHGVKK